MVVLNNKRTAIVVGAGIVGLAIARALAVRNYHVTVFERTPKAIGASVRNFGMIWPIGQPDGELYNRAILSKQIWKELCVAANIWYEEKGSLHLAYAEDELQVLEELQDIYRDRKYQLLNKEQVNQLSAVVQPDGLLVGLYSKEEMVVNPKQAIDQVAAYLHEQYHVQFIRTAVVTNIGYPVVSCGSQQYQADEIYVCSGADFETLYPELFEELPITKCKLQMLRFEAQADGLRIGPSLCGGLSLLHYQSFKKASSLDILRQRLVNKFPEHIKWGIHVMVSQHASGELTIGDSHEYGEVHDPFDKQHINALILEYLKSFTCFENSNISETWNGIYSKMTNGDAHVIVSPEPGVTIINGMGGAGMTLSFGLCEELKR